MVLQQPGPGECLVTDLTLMTALVGGQVHGEGRHADVGLVAVGAVLGSLGAEQGVGLPVAGEVGAGGEQFPTVGTLLFSGGGG